MRPFYISRLIFLGIFFLGATLASCYNINAALLPTLSLQKVRNHRSLVMDEFVEYQSVNKMAPSRAQNVAAGCLRFKPGRSQIIRE